MATILKGAPVVAAMNERNALLCEQLKAKGITPTLAVVRVGEREDDLSYERGVMTRCGKVGVAVRQFVLPADATQEQLREACAIACADEFIDRFPDGYETVLEQNAANLSGGQKQRLRIARAIVKQPKILILDDSTSAVDMATDEHIRRALKTAMPGSTKIIIAQRIASILSCDRIIVLHEGELSDVGTHAELMERSQIYRDVYDSQMREEGEQHLSLIHI